MGKGGKRRPEDSAKVRENWDSIDWKSGENEEFYRENTDSDSLEQWLDDHDIMKENVE